MKPLQHAYPSWEDDGIGESGEVWHGKMRIVRSARRMHKLRRRGVPLMHLGFGDGGDSQRRHNEDGSLQACGPWAWFETFESYESRQLAKRIRRNLRKLTGLIRYDAEGYLLVQDACFLAIDETKACIAAWAHITSLADELKALEGR